MGWHPVDSCAKWASSAKTNRCGALTETCGLLQPAASSFCPCRSVGRRETFWKTAYHSPAGSPVRQSRLSVLRIPSWGIISQSVMSPFTRSYMQTHRPRDHDASQWIATSTRLVANRALRYCRESGQASMLWASRPAANLTESSRCARVRRWHWPPSLVRCPDRNAGRSRGPRLVPQTARVGSVSEMPCPRPHPHPARAVGSGPS